MDVPCISCADDKATDPLCFPRDLQGARKDRVWYADVKMILKVEMYNAGSGDIDHHYFAWVQW